MEEEIEEEEGDEKNEWIARAVLLFCALVVAGVAAYTTFQLFAVYEIDISFSPPEAAQFGLLEEEQSLGTASFDIKKSQEEEGEVRDYEDKPIEPYAPREGFMRSPLIISEDVDGEGRLVFIVIVLEVILIGLIYWKLDRHVLKRRND